VLRNRLGITDALELARVEAELVGAAELVLYRERPISGRYDLAHLQAVHRHLFGEVYDWAGELRTVDIAKGHTLFARVQHVEREAHRVFDELRAKSHHLRGLDREGFTTEIGCLLGDLNALHPFRDGNGRAQRGFVQLQARDAGWQLAWAQINPAENVVRSAVAMADRDALIPLLEGIVSPLGEAVPPENWVLPRHRPGGEGGARPPT
jgi:cell filamentation protein